MKWCMQWLGGEFEVAENGPDGTTVEFSLPISERATGEQPSSRV